eukprot:6192240-Pleurochrysis_carterae.AAC.2
MEACSQAKSGPLVALPPLPASVKDAPSEQPPTAADFLATVLLRTSWPPRGCGLAGHPNAATC